MLMFIKQINHETKQETSKGHGGTEAHGIEMKRSHLSPCSSVFIAFGNALPLVGSVVTLSANPHFGE